MASIGPKKMAVYGMRVLAALLLAIAGLVWLAGTESALRWGVQQAERLSGGTLTVKGVHGSLYGPLRVGALSLVTEENRFELKEVNLDWSPLALLGAHVKIRRFALAELRIIEIKPSAEPLKLPQTLRLPVTFAAPAVSVQRVVLKISGREWVLRDVALGVERRADHYTLDLRGMTSEWGKGEARVRLGDTRPFAIAAHAGVRQTGDLGYRGEVNASGSLDQLLIDAKGQGLGGQATMKARLALFQALPRVEAQIQANRVNLALLGKDLPQTDIHAEISLVRGGTGALDGDILVRNALVGVWNRSRLPVREIGMHFGGSPDRLDLRGIRLDLAEGGRFAGSGRVEGERLMLQLSTDNFNPKGVHGKMHSMGLAGGIHLEAGPARQQLTADLRYRRFRIELDAFRQDAQLAIRKASVRSDGGALTVHGTVGLEGKQEFRLAGGLQAFNPADFGDWPAARVNSSFSATGHLAGESQGALEFAITGSEFRHQPLSGQGKLKLSATRMWDGDIKLTLGRNRLAAKGALGRAGDRLSFQLEAGQLAMLDPELGGRAHAAGTVEGQFSAPAGNFDLEGDGLSWRKRYRIGSLRAHGRIDKGGDGPLALDLALRALDAPQLHLDNVSLSGQGTRARHTLDVAVGGEGFDLHGRLAGGWGDKSGWAGQVVSLANRGRHAFQLRAPATLEFAAQHFLLRNGRLDFVGAELALDEVGYDAGRVASRGGFRKLPLGYVLALAPQPAELKTDLTLGGEWRLTAEENVNGHLALWREGGDVSLPTVPATALGLGRLALNVDVVDNSLHGRAEAAGTRLGSLTAEGQTSLSRRDGTWGITGDTPLQGQIDLDVGSLAWVQPLLDRTGALHFDGSLKAQVRAEGSFAKPQLTGTVVGERFTVALPDQGLRLAQGHFRVELQDQVLHLKELSARGGEGTLRGGGQLALGVADPSLGLTLKADKLEVLARPDRHLVLSGSADVSSTGKAVQVVAKLKADRGLIELSEGDAPTPSDDVVVLGRANTAEKKVLPQAVGFDLDVDLGDHFLLKGKGLDAQLGGSVKVSGNAGGLPSSRGSIRVVKGAYSAYGQRLEIERGILNFQGPIDNPGLNIVALRKNQPVEAGVAVTGTAQAPRVRLTSNPDVPDSDKLSWLVLGHGLDDSSGGDFSTLQAAAGALLAAGESVTLQQRVAHALGLEEVSLKGGSGLQSAVLTLGKRLSSRAYLSYEQGIAGAAGLVKINYALTKRVSVRAQAGSAAGVDLFYSFSFN